MIPSDRPLRGVRVLDLSRLLPGPYCTLLLRDLGAEVVKVEDVRGGDLMRGMAALTNGRDAYFRALNEGKKSLAVNLKDPRGRDAFLRLAAGAAVVVEGYRPGTADRLGIGHEAVRAVRPGVVYCSISAYGQTGPERERAAHDLNSMARSGILGLSGGRERALEAPLPIQVADLAAAMYAAVGILGALRESERTGAGRFLDVSMADSALAWTILTVAELSAGERGGRGRLPLSGKLPCYNVYAARDGVGMALSALEPKFWASFCAAVGRPDLRDRAFRADDETHAAVAAVFAERTSGEWRELAAREDFCCEPARPLEAALADPLFTERGMALTLERGGSPEYRLGNPVRQAFGEGPAEPPALGEHTAALLREAGYADAEIEALARDGAVGLG